MMKTNLRSFSPETKMMTKKNKITGYIRRTVAALVPAFILAVLSSACVDELDWQDPDSFPEGETTVAVSVNFMPMTQALTTRTSAPAGDVMKDLTDLCIVAYDREGKLLEGYPREITGYEESWETRKDSDTSDGSVPSETKTRRASFRMTIPYGRYYLYAVANLGRKGETTTLQELESRRTEILERSGLESVVMDWDDGEIMNNRQMLGYFTLGSESYSPHTGDMVETVDVARPDISLHCWLRRMASKVTVSVDGSGLRSGVTVHIKKATIHNIPVSCALWDKNKAVSAGEVLGQSAYEIDFRDITSTGAGSEDGKTWPCVSKDSPLIDALGNAHSETAPALFFFENMQGVIEGEDKRQEVDLATGKVKDSDDIQDNVPFGSYIEVEGYYESNALGNVSRGNITYRFMLGKDYINDFDAERNYHYKLTLCFNGNANDYDWHIDYTEDPDIYMPSPYFISYLYNREIRVPVKVNPGKGRKLVRLEAEIIDNRWGPWDDAIDAPAAGLDYNRDRDLEGQNIQDGFLSLKKVPFTRVMTHNGKDPVDWVPAGQWEQLNANYFYGLFGTSSPLNGNAVFINSDNYKEIYGNVDKSRRTYQTEANADGSEKRYETGTDSEYGWYSVATETDPKGRCIYNFQIPMFTQPKQLTVQTGHSGNNPYVAYERHAVVRFTAYFDKGEPFSRTVPIRQVRRVVNPKGVYRDVGNNTPFDVELMVLPRENSNTFQSVESIGPWKAYVVPGTDPKGLVTLSGYNTEYTDVDGQKVTAVGGKSRTNIKFRINFNNKGTDTDPAYAAIRVEYNDYSCEHVILVRQGYAPDKVDDAQTTYWHTLNMITDTREAEDPRDEGSLFKHGNSKQPIASSNQVAEYGDPGSNSANWINVQPYFFKDARDKDFVIEGESSTMKWYQITEPADIRKSTFDGSFGGKCATSAQYKELIGTDVDDLENAYGVLYAGSARKCQKTTQAAYHWRRGGSDAYGMRGTFVYNKKTGKNLFFPIGACGYGHRKGYREVNASGAVVGYGGIGVLRYSCNRSEIWKVNERPLFYDLYMRPGAIYWANSGDCLDINYFTFDFSQVGITNLSNTQSVTLTEGGKSATHGVYATSDACFVRKTGK